MLLSLSVIDCEGYLQRGLYCVKQGIDLCFLIPQYKELTSSQTHAVYKLRIFVNVSAVDNSVLYRFLTLLWTFVCCLCSCWKLGI